MLPVVLVCAGRLVVRKEVCKGGNMKKWVPCAVVPSAFICWCTEQRNKHGWRSGGIEVHDNHPITVALIEVQLNFVS